jgi:glutathione-independent formaldehyde dehydrogenase
MKLSSIQAVLLADGVDQAAKTGSLSIRLGLGWAKSHSFHTGQTPVLKYNRQLMQAILYDKIQIAKAVNVTVIKLDDAPKGYVDFDKGAEKKFVLDPQGARSPAANAASYRSGAEWHAGDCGFDSV